MLRLINDVTIAGCIAPGPTMTRSTFDAMPLDDLWDLHKRVLSILEERLDQERQKLEHQLEELSRKFGGAPSDTRERRRYPKVEPKFCNPADPSETWSGRGKQPHWVRNLLAAGTSLDDLRV
jgi:DNA-binding protein H-NS